MSHSFYEKHPEAFFEFYREKMMVLDAEPNPAHLKLAELEQAGKLKAVVTQNIDGLHQAAGSQTVYELHGSIHRNYCEKCGRFYDAEFVKAAEGVPMCSCGDGSNQMLSCMKSTEWDNDTECGTGDFTGRYADHWRNVPDCVSGGWLY